MAAAEQTRKEMEASTVAAQEQIVFLEQKIEEMEAGFQAQVEVGTYEGS